MKRIPTRHWIRLPVREIATLADLAGLLERDAGALQPRVTYDVVAAARADAAERTAALLRAATPPAAVVRALRQMASAAFAAGDLERDGAYRAAAFAVAQVAAADDPHIMEIATAGNAEAGEDG